MNVFLVLGLAWLAFLAKVVSGFVARRSGPTLRGLGSLQRRNDDDLYGPIGAGYGVPRPTSLAPQPTPRLRARRAARRRRDVFLGLGGLALVTGVLAVMIGGSVLVRSHLLIDTLLAVYVMALLRRRRTKESVSSSFSSQSFAPQRTQRYAAPSSSSFMEQFEGHDDLGQVLPYPARHELVYPSSRSQRTG